MKTLGIYWIFVLVFSPLGAQEHKNWSWGGEIDPYQEKLSILRYELALEIFPEERFIQGSNKVSFYCQERMDTLRLQLVENYRVTKVLIDDEEVNFVHRKEILDIVIPDGCANEATIFYEGKPPIAPNPPWKGGFTWEKDNSGNHWVGLTSQNEGAKIFMPCLDHPSSEPMEGVDLRITVPDPYFVAANGRLVSQEKSDSRITYHWSSDYPINNYGINFTIGKFIEKSKIFQSVGDARIPMSVYVLEENQDKAEMLLELLEISATTHEKYFGEFPFPKDKIAVVETPYLGMEHQTINAHGNNFQFVPMGEVLYDWLLHHELGHEWWGNKVTVADWADFWIHEGLTTYGDWLFFLEHGGDQSYMEQARKTAKGIKNLQPLVMPENSTAMEVYNNDLYGKGAYIIHMLRYIVGDDIFFPMLKAFLKDEQFTYFNQVNTGDWVDFVCRYSGRDLNDFFDLYLYSRDIPKVKITKKGKRKYGIQFTNIDFSLPLPIKTNTGIEKLEISGKPIFIESSILPVIDPEGWYLLEK